MKSEILYPGTIDMRNVLIHDYAGVNTQIVWETCKQDLVVLKLAVDEVL